MIEDQESAVEQASTLRSGERSYKERERERDVVWCGEIQKNVLNVKRIYI